MPDYFPPGSVKLARKPEVIREPTPDDPTFGIRYTFAYRPMPCPAEITVTPLEPCPVCDALPDVRVEIAGVPDDPREDFPLVLAGGKPF